MIEIINQQNAVKLKTSDFEEFTQTVFKVIPEIKSKDTTITFISDNEIKTLNKRFRGKDLTTDVLSFPNISDEFGFDENYLGDIAISVEQAKRQAIENNLTLELEIKQLIIHGLLHLCGYDHETDNGEMNSLELKIRDKLNIS